jgi:hypothetical protein
MKKLIIILICLPFLLLVGCSHNDKVNEKLQLGTKEINIPENNEIDTKEKLNSIELNNLEDNLDETIEDIKDVTIEDNELYENLKILCESPRIYNTDGEKRASDYLIKKLSEYGYQTKTQEFPVYKKSFDDFLTPLSVQQYFYKFTGNDDSIGIGKNIIATKKNTDSKKTLYITAHYDTTDTTGAIDNGSGVVVALEIARQLQTFDLPINVEFTFFSVEESGLQGSTYFVSQLSTEEKENALGGINIDLVGQNQDDCEVILKTYLAQINVLTLLMDGYYQFYHGRGEASDHTSFYMGGIPVIYFADNVTYQHEDTLANPLDGVNIDKLIELTKILCNFIINFNLDEYDNILISSYTKEYTDLPETEKVMGYSLIKVNKILKESGSGSKIQYLLKNDKDNQLKITEEDNRFLDEELIDQIKNFDIYKENIKYKIIEDEEKNTIIQYKDESTIFNYGVLEGDITVDEALQLIEERSGFTKNGTLLYDLD